MREGQEELAARVGPDGPVALSVGVVGQRVAGGREASRWRAQRPSTALDTVMASEYRAQCAKGRDMITR